MPGEHGCLYLYVATIIIYKYRFNEIIGTKTIATTPESSRTSISNTRNKTNNKSTRTKTTLLHILIRQLLLGALQTTQKELPEATKNPNKIVRNCRPHNLGAGKYLPINDVVRVRHQCTQTQSQLVFAE